MCSSLIGPVKEARDLSQFQEGYSLLLLTAFILGSGDFYLHTSSYLQHMLSRYQRRQHDGASLNTPMINTSSKVPLPLNIQQGLHASYLEMTKRSIIKSSIIYASAAAVV